MPIPSPDAEVLAIIGGRGKAATNIAVTGVDNETTAATIFIEPGDAPVYVFALSSGAIVWNVVGATERVEHLVVQPASEREGPGVAVAGLQTKQVRALTENACGSAYTYTRDETHALIKKLLSALRRSELRVVDIDSMGTANVPSGKGGPPDRTAGGGMITGPEGTFIIENGKPKRVNTRARNYPERQFKHFYPAGVVMLDPATVISTRPVAVYDVLPSKAGLLQLLGAGLISFTADGNYLIEGSIPRIPASLSGAHSVNFVLKEGVSRPKGDLGHSNLFDQRTGNCLEGICKTLEEMSKMR
ncbi:MAG: hypothetical protein V7651_09835 [Hyphomonas oceanitis]|uniref:hypothetical protein n=1 Tax=Hyphomonas oceanitis TaxID=81033 RepID=UPI003003A4BA